MLVTLVSHAGSADQTSVSAYSAHRRLRELDADERCSVDVTSGAFVAGSPGKIGSAYETLNLPKAFMLRCC